MSSKVFDFQTQLKIGKKGESEFEQLFGDLVTRDDGYIQDFTIKANGKKIELKMDQYCPTKTLNFFMERWSYKGQDGGPHQSLRKGVDYFIYFFPKGMQFHCFEVKALVKALDKICEGQYILNIYNKSHVTQGYKVKRADLEHLELNLEKLLKGKL
jgi:hypothetical protein